MLLVMFEGLYKTQRDAEDHLELRRCVKVEVAVLGSRP